MEGSGAVEDTAGEGIQVISNYIRVTNLQTQFQNKFEYLPIKVMINVK